MAPSNLKALSTRMVERMAPWKQQVLALLCWRLGPMLALRSWEAVLEDASEPALERGSVGVWGGVSEPALERGSVDVWGGESEPV